MNFAEQLRAMYRITNTEPPHKANQPMTESEARNMIRERIAGYERKRELEAIKQAKLQARLNSAAVELARRDVADVMARYRPQESVTGYVNVYGDFIKFNPL